MRRLQVLLDPRCRVCRRLREHVLGEHAWVRLDVREHGPVGEAATAAAAHADLVVRGERGEVWSGENAWRMVLWALRGSRRLSRTPEAARRALAEHDARRTGALLPFSPSSSAAPGVPALAPHAYGRRGAWGFLADVASAALGGLAAAAVLVGGLLGVVVLAVLASGGGDALPKAIALGIVVFGACLWSRCSRVRSDRSVP